ncbi:hypothetical protein AWW67_08535 [Roseivirga seohaensis]|uniref:Uncharacterized protein n=1 Tax=Roseivirga seohaensis TaxID=1914963 RepID=A0A150XQ36_9BACT|nr:hypothetical protein [Roseivirga seohaensis]KYG80859.1 hypothetical protein AWW67_08535 [Roseivirga seohaensis]
MSLTTEQHDILVKYLKDVGIKDQEPFEEFYDHIATGFEKNQTLELSTYIREISEPAFGGTKGMLKIVNEQNKIRKSLIWKRSKEIFLSLFGWPAIGLVMVSFVLIQIGTDLLGTKFITIFSLAIGLLIPLVVVIYGQISFYSNCKRRKLPYTSSNLNAWLMTFVHLPVALLNLSLNGLIPHVFGEDMVKGFLSAYPIVNVCLSTLFLLLGFTYLKLLKEQFIFKLEVA